MRFTSPRDMQYHLEGLFATTRSHLLKTTTQQPWTATRSAPLYRHIHLGLSPSYPRQEADLSSIVLISEVRLLDSQPYRSSTSSDSSFTSSSSLASTGQSLAHKSSSQSHPASTSSLSRTISQTHSPAPIPRMSPKTQSRYC